MTFIVCLLGLAYNETSFSDPKGVELDNAGI